MLKSVLAYSGMEPTEIIDLECAKCHMIGVKNAEDLQLRKKKDLGSSAFSCDACHTGHLFSVEQARKPETCGGCHGLRGMNQYAIYKGSKHSEEDSRKYRKWLQR